MYAELDSPVEHEENFPLFELGVGEMAVGVNNCYGYYIRFAAQSGENIMPIFNLHDACERPNLDIIVRRLRDDEKIILTNRPMK